MKNNIKNNNKSGHVCNIDNLGRIVIPSVMRRSYEMEKGEQIEMIAVDDGILIRKYQPGCMFCGNLSNITIFKGHIMCKDCLEEMAEKLK